MSDQLSELAAELHELNAELGQALAEQPRPKRHQPQHIMGARPTMVWFDELLERVEPPVAT